MWYRVNISRTTVVKDKEKVVYETYLVDAENFAEAGYKVMQHWNGECEVEALWVMKTMKPLGNDKMSDTNKVFIVKVAEDFVADDGTVKTLKYPVPFYADGNTDLQEIVKDYLAQGLQDMRVTTISETKWLIL